MNRQSLVHCVMSLMATIVSAFSLATQAHAQGAVIQSQDGSVWRADGRRITRQSPAPALSAVIDIFTVGIGCREGLDPGAKGIKGAGYLPPSFYQTSVESSRDGHISALVCWDHPKGGVLVADLRADGVLSPGDANAFRAVLGDLATSLASAEPERRTLALFNPVSLQVPMFRGTGSWIQILDHAKADSTVVIREWPKGQPSLLKIYRSAVPQQCSSVGLNMARPDWAGSTLYYQGLQKGETSIACADGGDGRLLMFELPLPQGRNLAEADVSRLRGLTGEIARAAAALR